MPTVTQRGVTLYYDRDTPHEHASSADEERDGYNGAIDAASEAAETLCGLLDELHEPPAGDVHKARLAVDGMGGKLLALVAEAERLLGKRP